MRDGRCKQDEKTIAASLEGHYRDEHLFTLKQSVQLYDFYKELIFSCEKEIEKQLQTLDGKLNKNEVSPIKRRKSKSSLHFDVRSELQRLTGIDLTRIDGMNENSVLKVLSETGTDMTAWPSEKHFASWLCLSPGNNYRWTNY